MSPGSERVTATQARRRARALLLTTVACGLAPASGRAQHVDMPARVRAGAPVPLRVVGLSPGVTVTLSADRVIADRGRPTVYRARAVYRADAAGAVDVARDSAVAGDYGGVDATGLFWSMRATATPADARPPGTVRVTVTAGPLADTLTPPLATAEVVLEAADPAVRREAVPSLPGAILYRLPGTVRRPVVIVLGGSEGGSSFAATLGPQLASAGYAVLGLPYYSPDWGGGRELPALPASFVDIPVERVAAAREWLRRQPGIAAERIGLYGISKGGEFALLAATRYPWLRAVAAVVPSDVVWAGFGPAASSDDYRASFSWRGRSLPAVPYDGLREAIARLGRGERVGLRAAHEAGRRAQPARAAAARIPVERYAGALLVAGGGRDGTWPSGVMAAAVAERRAEAGRRTTLLVFPDAGHGLAGTGYEPTNSAGMDGLPQATAHAQATVRAAVLDLFRRTLRPPDPSGRADGATPTPGDTVAWARADTAALLPAGFGPEGLAPADVPGVVWVGSMRDGRLLRVSLDGPRAAAPTAEVRPLPAGWAALGMAADTSQKLLWVAAAAIPEARGYTAVLRGRSALVAVDLGTGAPRRWIDAPPGAALGDVAVHRDGRVFASDGRSGAVYELAPGAGARGVDTLRPLVPHGTLRSAQGLALSADGTTLYVADYGSGVAAIDVQATDVRDGRSLGVARAAVRWPAAAPGTDLSGLDGLAVWPWSGATGAHDTTTTLLAVQNGRRPARLLRLVVHGDAITADVLLDGHPAFDEPTLGAVAPSSGGVASPGPLGARPIVGPVEGRDSVYLLVAASLWPHVASDGRLRGPPRSTPILRVDRTAWPDASP